MSLVLVKSAEDVYNVHMKVVTPSQARKNWFRLLDEAAAGEQILIERNGQRLVLRREEAAAREVPDYRGLIAATESARADAWSWDWSPDGLTLAETSAKETDP